MGKQSGWEAWTDQLETHFRVVLNDRDARAMSGRQIEDFYSGIALIAASFVPDERFTGVAESLEDRVESMRFDDRLQSLLDGRR